MFFLGIHITTWMNQASVPLFVSANRLRMRSRLPKCHGVWALDSGAFTEIEKNGKFTTPAIKYAREAEMWMRAIGGMKWASIQDWMCEPFMLHKTGLSVREHQSRTVRSYVELSTLKPKVPWAPILQGWAVDDYVRCYDMYKEAGVDLSTHPVVGVGSMCKRQNTVEAGVILKELHSMRLKLHAFGFKTTGLKKYAKYLQSADSMAWSFGARRSRALAGCRHRNCSNCLKYALIWRRKAIANVAWEYESYATAEGEVISCRMPNASSCCSIMTGIE